jgi:hypothetical protein
MFLHNNFLCVKQLNWHHCIHHNQVRKNSAIHINSAQSLIILWGVRSGHVIYSFHYLHFKLSFTQQYIKLSKMWPQESNDSNTTITTSTQEITALQAGRSQVWYPIVSLEFFIDIILPVTLWPWGLLSLLQKWVQEYFLGGGVKTANAEGWQLYHLHVPNVLKSGSLKLLEPSGPVQACNGIALPLPLHRK